MTDRQKDSTDNDNGCLLTSEVVVWLSVLRRLTIKKGKQKSPGRAISRSRSQPPTRGGREKATQINMCIAYKQMHDKHKDQLPLPQAR